jgi:Carboxypeptidase regulatory-like domain
MKRRRRKKRIISLLILAAAFALPGLGDKRKAAEPYVLLDGTVFRESGFALPNAEVVVVPDPPPDPRQKVKKFEAVSDSRGEFAFRLPTTGTRYIVKVRAKGFRNEEKSVTVQGEDRVSVTFQLHEESK